jgi:hypothetical protein
MLVMVPTQESEVRRIAVQSLPEQIVHETEPRKNPSPKKVGGVPEGVSSEFKHQCDTHTKRRGKIYDLCCFK